MTRSMACVAPCVISTELMSAGTPKRASSKATRERRLASPNGWPYPPTWLFMVRLSERRARPNSMPSSQPDGSQPQPALMEAVWSENTSDRSQASLGPDSGTRGCGAGSIATWLATMNPAPGRDAIIPSDTSRW